MRMAFLHAKPTSTTNPICTKMFTSRLVNSTPATEHSRQSGTTRMTASGSAQLSLQPRQRQEHADHRQEEHVDRGVPGPQFMNISSVHSIRIDSGSVSSAFLVDGLDRVAVADAGRTFPLIGAAV